MTKKEMFLVLKVNESRLSYIITALAMMRQDIKELLNTLEEEGEEATNED